jgi:hypothetical protein
MMITVLLLVAAIGFALLYAASERENRKLRKFLRTEIQINKTHREVLMDVAKGLASEDESEIEIVKQNLVEAVAAVRAIRGGAR